MVSAMHPKLRREYYDISRHLRRKRRMRIMVIKLPRFFGRLIKKVLRIG